MHMQEWDGLLSVNQFKLRHGNLPVLMLPLLLYTDDTSGNKSKKWNSFDVWAFMFAGLPRKENAKLQNIHFISTSNRCKATDMADPIVKNLLKLEEGVKMFDAKTNQDVIVVAPVLCILADNPRASEITNHCGSSANKFCRKCLVAIAYRVRILMMFMFVINF